MDKGGSKPKIPKAPSFQQGYKQGTNVYLQFLNRYLNAEQGARATQDPFRLQQQQALQNEFGPTQYAQQLQALQQLNPQWFNLQRQTGQALSNNLSQGGPSPQQSALYNQLLGNASSDLSQGYNLAPGMEQQIQQSLRGAQAARGNILGGGAAEAEAYATGDRANQLYQQRLANAANIYGMSSPQQQALNSAMSFQGLSTPSQQIGSIAPISPDRSMAYVNPNAGFQGVNAANQAYQNTLGAYGLQQQPQSNPWGSIIGGVAAAAPYVIGAFSDPRLKSNVKRIGRAKGMNVYKYDIQEPKRTEIGVMADEVAAKRPDAVVRDPASGYMKVMYHALGLPNPVQVPA